MRPTLNGLLSLLRLRKGLLQTSFIYPFPLAVFHRREHTRSAECEGKAKI